MVSKILSEDDINEYMAHFQKLNYIQREKELDIWEKKIQGDHNNYELLTFLKILDYMNIDIIDSDISEVIEVIDKSKKELTDMIDYILDTYNNYQLTNKSLRITDRQKSLLDKINNSISECDTINNHINEKIIN